MSDATPKGAFRLLCCFVAAVALAAAGCTSMYQSMQPGSGQPVIGIYVDSEPIGGLVRLNGIRVGTTPTLVAMEVNEDGSLYNDVTLSVDQRTNARAPNSEEVRVLWFRAGEILPARVLFPLGEEPRRSGRALIER